MKLSFAKAIAAYTAKYRVDENGTVTSPLGRRLKLSTTPAGYRFFTMRIAGRSISVYVHQLQAYTLYGDMAAEDNVMFLDGNKRNLAASNIVLAGKGPLRQTVRTMAKTASLRSVSRQTGVPLATLWSMVR